MDEYKITQSEINSNNVKSAADHLTDANPQNLKDIFDNLPELIAEKLNGFIAAVINKFSGYYDKNEIDSKEKTLNDAIGAKANSKDVYAKNETYTKDETRQQIDQKVTEIGAGDMAKSVYDTNNSGVVDNAEKLGGIAASAFL